MSKVFEKDFGDYKGRVSIESKEESENGKVKILVGSEPSGHEEEVAERVREILDKRGIDFTVGEE